MPAIDVLAKESVRNLVMPISVAQYHELSALGLIPEKTELLEGIIFKKMTKSPLHEFIAHKLYHFFSEQLSDLYLVRKEAPLTLAASEPEPDISIVKGRLDDFVRAHPSHAELVIEVAVSAPALDREKIAIYAAANIPECWIVRAQDKVIERYTDPSSGSYQTVVVVTATQSIDTPCGPLALGDLFG